MFRGSSAASAQERSTVVQTLALDPGEIFRRHIIGGNAIRADYRVSGVWLTDQRAPDVPSELGDQIGGHLIGSNTVKTHSGRSGLFQFL